MAKKKTYVDVIGITRGKAPEVLATFDERKEANWHINNTFVEEDKCIVKTTSVKGDAYVKEDVAEDRDVYLKSIARMKIVDLEKVLIETESDTLLRLTLDGEVQKKTDLGKLELLDTNQEDVKVLKIIHNESDQFPYSKVKKRLEDELISGLIGDESETEEVEETESEETESEETEVETEDDKVEADLDKVDEDEETEEVEVEEESEEEESEEEESGEEESEEEENDEEENDEEEIEEEETEEEDTEEEETEEDDSDKDDSDDEFDLDDAELGSLDNLDVEED